jgi:hypothetical protein
MVSQAHGRDAARDLKKMIGFTIIDASWVTDVTNDDIGEKCVKLGSGGVFKVDFLLLNPLPFSDVIVFAKAPSKEIIEAFGDKLPEYTLYQFKLLIDNEVHDATPLR